MDLAGNTHESDYVQHTQQNNAISSVDYWWSTDPEQFSK